MQMQITSRVLVIVLTAFPLAALGLEFDRLDRTALAAFSTYEEVRAHVESGLLSSYWACFGAVLLGGFAYLAMIEGVAFLLRLVLRIAKREQEQPAA